MTGLYWDEDDQQEGLLTRRSPEHCLSEQEVEDFLFQRLSGVSREAVEEHLLFCEDCRKRVEEEESFIEAMRGAAARAEMEPHAVDEAPEEGPQTGGRRFSPPRWAIAASVALLAVGGSLAVRQFRGGEAVEVKLVAVRAADPSGANLPPERRSLSIDADVRGLPPLESFRWAVVDTTGKIMAEGVAGREGNGVRFVLQKGLPSGRYWVRIQDPDTGLLLREFALQVGPGR